METEEELSAREQGLFPIRSLWFKLGFFFFLLAWLSYLLYEATAWEGFEDYLFVYLLAPIIYVLLIYRIVVLVAPDELRRLTDRLAFLDRIRANERIDDTVSKTNAEPHGRESKAEEEKYAIYMILWVAALPVGIFLFGMAWTLPVYIFGFTWFFTGSSRRATLVTVVAVAFIYFLFVEILNVLLWTGYLGLPNPVDYLS